MEERDAAPRGSVRLYRGQELAETLLIYTHPECSYSDALKEELGSMGASYEEIDLALHPEEWAKVEELTGGERITPVTVEGELVTVGFGGVG